MKISPITGLPFNFLMVSFLRAEVFKLNNIEFITLKFMVCISCALRNSFLHKGCKTFLVYFV